MLNQVVIAGRISHMTDSKITLAVSRPYKNEAGIYDTDFIPVKIKGGIAETVLAYCKKTDVVGVKGRLEVDHGKLILVAEKVSFLSSGKRNEEEE
jgi:single-strand DNA-binding protein